MPKTDFSTQDGNLQAPFVGVDLRRRPNSTSAIKAHADVEIRMDQWGSMHVFGFSVYHVDEKPPVVLPPAQKGQRRSFPHIKLTGKIRAWVESAILAEYESSMEADA